MAHTAPAVATALTFHSTTFNVIDRNGQPWLRSPQIAEALGYNQANRITDLYNRNATEFTDSMTAVVKLPDLVPQSADAGQMREVRIFSLRGAHLLGMFARTKVAAEFRRWALDVLDTQTQNEPSGNSGEFMAALPAEALAAARSAALTYFDALRAGQKNPRIEEIPEAVLTGIVSDMIINSRWCVSINPFSGQMQMNRIDPRAFVVTPEDLPHIVRESLTVSPKTLFDIAQAGHERIRQKFDALERKAPTQRKRRSLCN